MNGVNLIMPMAGRGSRFSKAGYDFPKPLLEIYNYPFFFWSTQSIRKFVNIKQLVFVVLKEHVDNFKIDERLHDYYPEADVVVLPKVTEGAVITGIEGIKVINNDCPVIFNDCDHLFKSNEFYNLCNKGNIEADGILLTFKSDKPNYSFVGYDENKCVNRTAEKIVISNDAICGCYYFKNKDIFMSSSSNYLLNCSYSEYYMSGVYNSMIKNGCKILGISTDFHVPFGVPEEYELAKNSDYYRELL